MRTALILFALLAMPAFAGQTVWKWVDDKGVTHYSDRPVPGATKVEVSVANRSDAPPPGPVPSAAQRPAQGQYSSLQILKPAPDETFTNVGGTVEVTIQVEPPLQPVHQLNLYLDGQRVTGFADNALSYALKNVTRGTHTLAATILDGRGRRLIEAPPVAFHVRQESVATPPVGPSLRTPPKPPRN
jgi:hypothetical protein